MEIVLGKFCLYGYYMFCVCEFKFNKSVLFIIGICIGLWYNYYIRK